MATANIVNRPLVRYLQEQERLFRVARNLSPTVVARAMRVTPRQVHRWLDGTRTPPPAMLLLAELLWGPGQAEWPLDRKDLSGE